MPEAERLCDRVAVLDRGRLAALDTPGALIARAGVPQRVRFRAAGPFDGALLDGLDRVGEVRTERGETVVTGTGDLLRTVSAALARHGVPATETRLETATLEDAFLALTGRAPEEETA